MPPYDRIVPEALRELYPNAKINVTNWPTEGRSLAQLEEWARSIRAKKPHLVVVAVPAAAGAENDEALIRSYAWILNWSISFGHRTWDRLAILPSVTAPLGPDQKHGEELARRIMLGADAACVERRPGENRPAAEIVREWIRRQTTAAGSHQEKADR